MDTTMNAPTGRSCIKAETVDIRRRRLLGLAAVPLAWTVLRTSAHADESPCIDLDALPPTALGLRRSLGFKLQSPDPDKRCALCVFFKPTAGSDCGQCEMFNGGAVAATSVCDSWSPS